MRRGSLCTLRCLLCALFLLVPFSGCPAGWYGANETCALCPAGSGSPALSTSIFDCECEGSVRHPDVAAGSTEITQYFVCIGVWQHAIGSELLTCIHANGSVIPFVHYDILDATEQMPCVQVTLADYQTAAATNAFNFSVHVQFDGNAVCFGVLQIDTILEVSNERDCEQFHWIDESQSVVITFHQPLCKFVQPNAVQTVFSHVLAGVRNLSCPAGTTTPAGATALADCVCAPGFSLVAGACEPCAADSYKATADNAACVPCGANARSLPGAAEKTSVSATQASAEQRAMHARTTHTRPTLSPRPAGRVLATPRRRSARRARRLSRCASATPGVADQTAGRVRHVAPTFSSQPPVHSVTHTPSAPLPALSVPSACATSGTRAPTIRSAKRVGRGRSRTTVETRRALPARPTPSPSRQKLSPTTPPRRPRRR